MADRDKPSVGDPTPAYESPEIEDLPTPEGVTVTAAGTPTTLAAPRDL